MKTREQIEKEFDEKFLVIKNEYWCPGFNPNAKEVKDFIFNEIIPEVFREIEKKYGSFNNGCGCCFTIYLDSALKELGFNI